MEILAVRLGQSVKNTGGKKVVVDATPSLVTAVSPFLDDASWTTAELQAASKAILATICDANGVSSEDDLVVQRGTDLLAHFTELFSSPVIGKQLAGVRKIEISARRKPTDWMVDEQESKFENDLDWEKRPGVKHAFLWTLSRCNVGPLPYFLGSHYIHKTCGFLLLLLFFLGGLCRHQHCLHHPPSLSAG